MSYAQALAVAAAAIAVSGAYGSTRRREPFKGIKAPKGAKAVTGALDELEIRDPLWRAWALWVAKGESGWSAGARNGSVTERAASAKAYDRLVKSGRWPCPRNRGQWSVGSGGLYGQLAPFTAMFLPGHEHQCNVQDAWNDPVSSTIAMFAQTKGVARALRSKVSDPNMLQLRALYGLLSRDPAKVDTAKRRAGYSRTLERAGLPPSFLDAGVPLRVPGPSGAIA